MNKSRKISYTRIVLLLLVTGFIISSIVIFSHVPQVEVPNTFETYHRGKTTINSSTTISESFVNHNQGSKVDVSPFKLWTVLTEGVIVRANIDINSDYVGYLPQGSLLVGGIIYLFLLFISFFYHSYRPNADKCSDSNRRRDTN